MAAIYYERYQDRNKGATKVVSILKVDADGTVYYIDLERKKFTTNKTIGSLPMRLKKVDKRHWNNAKKKLQQFIDQL